ncbi:MAG: hypothetical protein DCC56_04955 [Anaerolineae bacterium]|nr:MAG: hypothetical protein DCC56_04955 [Anaerolineae bacterium]WKZ43797.1 MAG: hypothetical protein QY302_17010 [Anaerolineales bacterium]
MDRDILVKILSVLLLSVGPILLGISTFYARDFYWKITSATDLMKGKESKRTKLWDFWQFIGGVFLIGFGVVMFFVIVFS